MKPWQRIALIVLLITSFQAESVRAATQENVHSTTDIPQQGIYAGNTVSDWYNTGMVLLRLSHNNTQGQPGGSPHCSGVLVQNSWVLTAAHCVSKIEKFGGVDLQPIDLEVVRGPNGITSTSTAPQYQVSGVDEIILRESFVFQASIDVALLKLSSPMWIGGSFSSYRQPIYSATPLNWAVRAYGYGPQDLDDGRATLSTGTFIVNRTNGFFYSYKKNARDQYPRSGDSGGPSFFWDRNLLTGIHSWSDNSGDRITYDVSSQYFRDWVLEHIDSEMEEEPTLPLTVNNSGQLNNQVVLNFSDATPAMASRYLVAVQGEDGSFSQGDAIFSWQAAPTREGGQTRLLFQVKTRQHTFDTSKCSGFWNNTYCRYTVKVWAPDGRELTYSFYATVN